MDLRQQVINTLGDHANEFDVDGILDEIGRDLNNLDEVPDDVYWIIVKAHEK